MDIGNWISLASTLLTCISLVVGATFALTKYFNGRIDTERDRCNAQLAIDRTNNEQHVMRVYDRFDQYKKESEGRLEQLRKDSDDKFVVKDLCSILHSTNSENFHRLEAQMKAGFDEIKILVAPVQALSNQVEVNTKRIDKLEGGK
jgi:hypothetical protein